MKNSVAVIVFGLFGCQPGQIELTGVAKTPGNPTKFVELCEKGDTTAMAIFESKFGLKASNCGKRL